MTDVYQNIFANMWGWKIQFYQVSLFEKEFSMKRLMFPIHNYKYVQYFYFAV